MPSSCIIPIPRDRTCHTAQPLTATAEQGGSLDGSALLAQDSGSWSAELWGHKLEDRRDAGEQEGMPR